MLPFQREFHAKTEAKNKVSLAAEHAGARASTLTGTMSNSWGQRKTRRRPSQLSPPNSQWLLLQLCKQQRRPCGVGRRAGSILHLQLAQAHHHHHTPTPEATPHDSGAQLGWGTMRESVRLATNQSRLRPAGRRPSLSGSGPVPSVGNGGGGEWPRRPETDRAPPHREIHTQPRAASITNLLVRPISTTRIWGQNGGLAS